MPRTILKPVKGKKKFDELFTGCNRFRVNNNLALIKFEKNTDGEIPNYIRTVYYAVVISKKTAKKAVIRNRVKRLMRESLRQLLRDKESLFENIGYIVLIWRWAPLKKRMIVLKDVKPIVEQLLNKSKVYRR